MYPSWSTPDMTPRHLAGTFSIASDAPTPHSPPMPTPNSSRQATNAAHVGASPLRTDRDE